jgi:hypothetical protein
MYSPDGLRNPIPTSIRARLLHIIYSCDSNRLVVVPCSREKRVALYIVLFIVFEIIVGG